MRRKGSDKTSRRKKVNFRALSARIKQFSFDKARVAGYNIISNL